MYEPEDGLKLFLTRPNGPLTCYFTSFLPLHFLSAFSFFGLPESFTPESEVIFFGEKKLFVLIARYSLYSSTIVTWVYGKARYSQIRRYGQIQYVHAGVFKQPGEGGFL